MLGGLEVLGGLGMSWEVWKMLEVWEVVLVSVVHGVWEVGEVLEGLHWVLGLLEVDRVLGV